MRTVVAYLLVLSLLGGTAWFVFRDYPTIEQTPVTPAAKPTESVDPPNIPVPVSFRDKEEDPARVAANLIAQADSAETVEDKADLYMQAYEVSMEAENAEVAENALTLLVRNAGETELGGEASGKLADLTRRSYTQEQREALEQGLSLFHKGNLVEARNLLAQAFQKDLTKDDLKAVRTAMIAINKKLVFSPVETPDSEIYTIKPGDMLYNIAQKFHTEVGLLMATNGISDPGRIRPGQKIKILKGSFRIVINKTKFSLDLFYNDTLARTYPIAHGKDNKTPEGEFQVSTKLENPFWTKTDSETGRKEQIPPGPDNELGTRWIGFQAPFNDYGIHGTIQPDSIGTQASNGCIRMHNKDVEELYRLIPRKTVVTILP